MVFVKAFLFSLILSLSSCAKISYMFSQGIGQLKLQSSAKKNEEVLKDPNVKNEDKEKIKKIGTYKNYFYRYWDKKSTDIYTETSFLKQEAVTYLVIASPYNKIEAKEECFIFAGCFPYLGFFSKDHALEHQKDLTEDDYVSYMRPVYAYSTLGYFTDTILSSFFYYNEEELAELIFHELFHTIFFAKDEVELNENLAQYFGKEMAIKYFQINKAEQKKRKLKKQRMDIITQLTVEKVKLLNGLYDLEKPATKAEAEKILENYLAKTFIPEIKEKCKELNLKNCSYAKKKWNNASLAAFLTYEKKNNEILELHQKLKLSLKDFFLYIEKKYEEFKETDPDTSFSKFLFDT